MAVVHAGVSQPKVETLDFRIELPVCPSVSGSGMPMVRLGTGGAFTGRYLLSRHEHAG